MQQRITSAPKEVSGACVREKLLEWAQAAAEKGHVRVRQARETIRSEEARLEQHVRTQRPTFDRYRNVTQLGSVPSSHEVRKERRAMRRGLLPATEKLAQATRVIVNAAGGPAASEEERVLSTIDGAIAKFSELLGGLQETRPEV